MLAAATPAAIAFVALVTFVAGVTNGVAGFGFAVIGTMAFATVVDPATAVVFMIVPILAVNVSLVNDLSRRELRACSTRFRPLIAAGLPILLVSAWALFRPPEAVGLGYLLGWGLAAYLGWTLMSHSPRRGRRADPSISTRLRPITSEAAVSIPNPPNTSFTAKRYSSWPT